MPVVSDKYRGTREYQLVYAELINAARYRGTVTYQELAVIVGLPPQGSHMGKELGQLLGEISEDEHDRGRPKLSAVAVNVEGVPGPGFFALARDLDKLRSDARGEERRFWESERDVVSETWRRPLAERER